MVKGLYTAYTGMMNEQNRMDVLSNNLANSSTTGYKKDGSVAQAFSDQLAIKIKDHSEADIPRGLGVINQGVKIGETYTDYSSGPFQVTDIDSNLAVAGDGFFAIAFTDRNGNTSVKYTRDGEFTVNSDGYLVTSDGNHVLNQTGAMNSDPSEANWVRIDPLSKYTIDSQRNIWQNDTNIGNVGLVDFADRNYLSRYGENAYDLVAGGTVQNATGTIEQGTLEDSNVNVVDEMVNLISVSRAYEAGQKMIQAEDETLQMAVSDVGRVS